MPNVGAMTKSHSKDVIKPLAIMCQHFEFQQPIESIRVYRKKAPNAKKSYTISHLIKFLGAIM